jgi:hypothetical protein
MYFAKDNETMAVHADNILISQFSPVLSRTSVNKITKYHKIGTIIFTFAVVLSLLTDEFFAVLIAR